MLFFNQSKVLLICLFTVLISSHVAYGGIEFSGHFGYKNGGQIELSDNTVSLNTKEKNQPFHLGADTFYRYAMGSASFGLGLRYRFDFQGEKTARVNSSTANYKFTTHRVALLANYRMYIDQLFVGGVLGLDIWKSLNFSEDFGDGARVDGRNVRKSEVRSNQFMWNQISGQLGLELGFMPTSNFFIKLETGYDLFSFTKLEVEWDGVDQNAPEENKMGLNGLYLTLGIGLLLE